MYFGSSQINQNFNICPDIYPSNALHTVVKMLMPYSSYILRIYFTWEFSLLPCSVSKHIPKASQSVGYCPQDDALDQYLTVREMLQCFSRLRGIPSRGIQQVNSNFNLLQSKNRVLDTILNTFLGRLNALNTIVQTTCSHILDKIYRVVNSTTMYMYLDVRIHS